MHKRCEMILKELESEGKLKLWWDFKFPEKEPLKLRLKDMLEEQVDEKYYLSGAQIERIKTTNYNVGKTRIQEKEYCDTLCAREWKEPKCVQVGTLDIKGQNSIKRVYSDEGLSPTLTNMQGGNRQPKILEDFYKNRPVREYEQVAPTLRSERRGLKVLIKNNTKRGYLEAYEGDGVYINTSNKRGTVQPQSIQTITTRQDLGVIETGIRIRKLTPKECWRLMGFDDEDFEKAKAVPISNTQLYKQAGNSIVVNVLEKIFKNLLKEE